MINIALAITVGIIAIIALAAIFNKGNEKGNDSVIRNTVNEFLDYLDYTRETRYSKGKANRNRLIRQYDGYRHDWYAYEDEWACNFSMD